MSSKRPADPPAAYVGRVSGPKHHHESEFGGTKSDGHDAASTAAAGAPLPALGLRLTGGSVSGSGGGSDVAAPPSLVAGLECPAA
jgi:hypothetical protein